MPLFVASSSIERNTSNVCIKIQTFDVFLGNVGNNVIRESDTHRRVRYQPDSSVGFALDFSALFDLTALLDLTALFDLTALPAFPVDSLILRVFGSSAGVALAFSARAFSTCRVGFAGFFPSPYDAIRT